MHLGKYLDWVQSCSIENDHIGFKDATLWESTRINPCFWKVTDEAKYPNKVKTIVALTMTA